MSQPSALAATAAATPAMPAIPKPGTYSGDPDACKGFRLQCKMYFEAYPNYSEACQYTTFLALLTGVALKWASAVFNNEAEKDPFDVFLTRFHHVFDHSAEGKAISEQLLSLKQYSHRVSEYALDIRILGAKSGWNEGSLQAVFSQGLNTIIRKKLACRDVALSVDSLIDLAIRLDNLSRNHKCEFSLPMSINPTADPSPCPSPCSWAELSTLRRRKVKGER